jgi:hypothetical protein
MSLHPACEPIGMLLGTWRGAGRGYYPTIDDFEYAEEVVFGHNTRPFLAYSQRTWNPETEAPMHAETGFWRCTAEGALEVLLVHPFGLAEVSTGTVAGSRISLTSIATVIVPSAKVVSEVTRTIDVDGDRLTYELCMAAVGEPLQSHLQGRLERVG